jgi:TonB family protein
MGKHSLLHEGQSQFDAPATNQGDLAFVLRAEERPENEGVLPVFTFIVWGLCLSVGILGLLVPYQRPRPVSKPPEPISVQALQVELKAEPVVAEPDQQSPGSMELPADEIAPAPLPVARPSPAIAFAIPVSGPIHVVPLSQAAYSTPSTPPSPPSAQPPRVRILTFGEGEGRQPAPEYPRRALQEHQQGVVVLQFVVGENGQVSSAEATQPCVWPALNEAALRTIREKWRFPAGATRVYEIAIRFQLNN